MKEEKIVKRMRIMPNPAMKLNTQLIIEKRAADNNKALKFICSSGKGLFLSLNRY